MRDVMQVLCDALIEAGRDDAAEVVRLAVEQDDLARWLRTEDAYATPGWGQDESYGCPECNVGSLNDAHGVGCTRAAFLSRLVPGWREAEFDRAWAEAAGENEWRDRQREYARREAEREVREPLLRQAREASDALARRVAADLFSRTGPDALAGLGAWVDREGPFD